MSMAWHRIDAWCAESDAGYRIAISHHGAGYCYQAYGPARPQWRAELRVRYALGEPVPRERELIGSATTPEEARAMCERHLEENNHAA